MRRHLIAFLVAALSVGLEADDHERRVFHLDRHPRRADLQVIAGRVGL